MREKIWETYNELSHLSILLHGMLKRIKVDDYFKNLLVIFQRKYSSSFATFEHCDKILF